MYVNVDFYTDHDLKKFITDPQIYMATAARKGRTEVVYKRLSEADKELFGQAKQKEVDQFLLAQACRSALRKHTKGADLMRMRWVLPWKEAPELANGRKA